MVFQVGRGRNEDKRVIFGGYLIDVRREVDVVDVEVHTGEIGRVMAQSAEVGDAVVAPHIPSDMSRVRHHHLGDGGSPRATPNDGHAAKVGDGAFLPQAQRSTDSS